MHQRIHGVRETNPREATQPQITPAFAHVKSRVPDEVPLGSVHRRLSGRIVKRGHMVPMPVPTLLRRCRSVPPRPGMEAKSAAGSHFPCQRALR